ncbi:MAG: TonB-dependent receptor [Epsilonproteobacteria bacterium]|nr:TonB-dependent receptor [Campylobacterota bacterium]
MKHTVLYNLFSILLLNSHLIADEKLEDISVITASKSPQNLQNITSNTEVITATEIEERHYNDISDAINSLSGVDINSNGGLGQNSSLYLRGFDTNKVLVLIDGIRYNDVSSLSGAAFAHLMIKNIEQIEVIKGAQSGIWGADASAGVINIISKKAKEGFYINASQEHGSFETSKTHAGISYKNDRFYLKASHNHISTNGFSSVAPRGSNLDSFEDDGYENDTTSLKAGFQINATNKIDIAHTIIDTDTKADPYDSTIYAFDPNGQYDIESKTKLSSINFNHVDSFNEVNLFAKQSTFERYYPQDAFSQHFSGETKEYGVTSKIPYGEEHFVLWGGEYKDFEDRGAIDKSYDNKAFFISNHNKFSGLLGGETIVTESLRQDNYSAFDNKLTGKIGLKHIHGSIEGLTTSINYGTAYNVPTHYHLYDPFSGNSSLNAEDTKGYDITLAYKDLKLTYFNNNINNMIEYQSNYDANGNWIGGNFENVNGESKLKGFEVAYEKEIIDNTLLSLNYTNLDAKDREGNFLARRADESLKFSLDYYGIDKFHLGLNGEYIGERYERPNKQGTQTGKYTIANFTSNYQVDKHMSLYGKVVNITDKYYQTADGYSSSPRAIYGGMKLNY